MEIRFNNVTKDNRKELVKAVGEITGCTPEYQGAPGFAFAVGGYTIDRYGILTYDDRTSAEDAQALLSDLAARGFVCEGDIDGMAPDASAQNDDEPDGLTVREGIADGGERDEAINRDGDHNNEHGQQSNEGLCPVAAPMPVSGSGKLSISVPLADFADTALDNLEKLVAAKAWIIRKMTDADALPIERGDGRLTFPWFKPDASADEADAYSRLIAGLCETAKQKKRVVATERQLEDGDNEKFKARCFLLALGFIGKEYGQARKILLAPMSGSGSHRSGNHKRQGAGAAVEPAADGVAHVGAEAPRNDADAAMPFRCGECPHHCYYTEGQLLTGAGDVVDTSNRAPEKYTHYCLKAPSGFRKLKHATEWSGFETAPKWCPLHAASVRECAEPASA